MNIVFYRYNSICEPGYIAAFRTLGIDVTECQRRNGEEVSLRERMEELGGLMASHRPLFVFSINYFPFISMICDRLQVLYVAVSVDCPVFEIYDITIRSPYNRVFLFDREQYLSIYDENPAGIFYLPLGVDVERLENNIGAFAAFCGKEAYDYDVSFVGSLYNEKDAYAHLSLTTDQRSRMEKLLDTQRRYQGLDYLDETLTEEEVDVLRSADPAFRPSDRSIRDISRRCAIDGYFSDHLTVMDRKNLLNTLTAAGFLVHLFTMSDTSALESVVCHGAVNSTTEMPLVFRRSRINLNYTMRAIRTGLPQRIWDVLGSGGFLLTNAQAEIPDYLKIGEHLDVWESMEELTEKVSYWLSHEEERKEVARAGYAEVKEKHTILRRVAEMIGMIVKGLE